MTSSPYDIAYLAGLDDGMATVAQLTLHLYIAYAMISILAILVLYLMTG